MAIIAKPSQRSIAKLGLVLGLASLLVPWFYVFSYPFFMEGPWPARDFLIVAFSWEYIDDVLVAPQPGYLVAIAFHALILGALALAAHSIWRWENPGRRLYASAILATAGLAMVTTYFLATSHSYFGFPWPYFGELLWLAFASIVAWSALRKATPISRNVTGLPDRAGEG